MVIHQQLASKLRDDNAAAMRHVPGFRLAIASCQPSYIDRTIVALEAFEVSSYGKLVAKHAVILGHAMAAVKQVSLS